MRFLVLLLFSMLCSPAAKAQWKFRYFQDTPVKGQAGENVLFPWAGGLGGVQYSQMDLNNDGRVDIVAFDRSSGRKICFLNLDDKYQFAPDYEQSFPEEISNFMILQDYDQDGKKDIFTTGNLGISVFRNISTGQIPRWEKVIDFISYESLSGNQVNLQVNFNDYPYIGDIDDDGDLDIFNFSFSGIESKIIFYKNESVETSGRPDITNYRVVDNFWGEVEDCDCGVFAFGDENCNSAVGKSSFNFHVSHAGGKSILINDFDGDGRLELVTSHEECRNLYAFLESASSGIFPSYNSLTTNFPSDDNPAAFNFYPNAMLIDVDLDGMNEIIVSPNIEPAIGTPVDFSSSNWLYESTASGYELKTKSFLQEDMIDWGTQASPAFYDLDKDGDLDLFVAYTDLDESGALFSAIAHYENTGNAGSPAFSFVTDNFLNIRSTELANMTMQWKDIDNDGTTDLALQGTIDNSNQLFFVYNNNEVFDIDARQQITDVSIGFGFSVHLADVAGTEQVDLLLGKSSGGLRLYENTGSGRNPAFNLKNDTFLGIGDDFFSSSLKVLVDDVDNDGNDDLLTSDLSGRIRVYGNFRTNNGSYDTLLVNNPLQNKFEAADLGKRNLLSAAKLFDEDFPAIILGSPSGGLRIIRNIEEFPLTQLGEQKLFILYPNPNRNGILGINTNKDAQISIVTLTGQRVSNDFLLEANSGSAINISNLSVGLYLVTARFTDGTQISRKLVVE